jgi:hypothetical protein
MYSMVLAQNFKSDLFIIISLCIRAFTDSQTRSNQISHEALVEGDNFWFQADTTRVFPNMTDRRE